MPIYEYICDSCSDKFEELVLDQNAEITCPECGSSRVSKCLSVFAHRMGSANASSSSSGPSSCSTCSSSSCSGCSCG